MAAADAGAALELADLVLAQAEDAAGALEHRAVQVELHHAHHGAAVDDLAGVIVQPAAEVDDVLQGGAHAHQQVLGLGHGRAR